MDLNEWSKNIDLIMKVAGKYLMYPFLVILAAGSRVFYEGFIVKNKMPTDREIFAIVIMSIFTSTLTYLIAVDLGASKNKITWLVMVMGFVGHNAVLWLLENWHKYLPKNNNQDNGPIND